MAQTEDPREAARKLAAAQKDLHDRTAREQIRNDRTQPLAGRLKPLQAEQEALKRAAEQLSVPPPNKGAQDEKKRAEALLGKAADSLKQNQPAQARTHMNQAQQALEQLANKLPSLQERRQEAQRELARMQREQDSLARQAEEAAKDSKEG